MAAAYSAISGAAETENSSDATHSSNLGEIETHEAPSVERGVGGHALAKPPAPEAAAPP